MPLNALPNEILLQMFRNLYPPGAFEYWAPYGLTDEIMYPPHTYQTPGWKPSNCAAYTEFDRCRQYFAALKKADMAMQAIATMNHRLRSLSRDILVLRATYKVILPSLGQVLDDDDVTWGMLVAAMSERDTFLARMMEGIVEDEKVVEAQEEEEKRRARGEL